MQEKILVVGLGNIGLGIAKNLQAKYFDIVGVDISKERCQAFENMGGTTSNSIVSVIEDCTIIVICLVSEDQIKKVFLDTQLLSRIRKNSIIISTSTVSVEFIVSFGNKCKEQGIHLLDAPVSGGVKGADSGNLSVFLSGDSSIVERAKVFFDTIGKKIHHFGEEIGIGSKYKIIHQLLAGVHIVAAAEAISLAEKVGIDMQSFYDMVCGAAGNSWMFQDRGARMIEKYFESKSDVNIFVKDLSLVLSLADSVHHTSILCKHALQKFIAAQEGGYGEKDDSSVIEMYNLSKYI